MLKVFAAGEQLIYPGQYLKSSALILSGRVKLYRERREGGEYFMYYLEPGTACALSMICATRQQKSELLARAVEDTVALLIPVPLTDELMKQYRSWYEFVVETYRSRFEELLEVIDSIAFKNMDQRLLHYLQHQQQALGHDPLLMTHQQIASDLNTSREVVSRLLKKMEQQGLLRLARNAIFLEPV